NPVKFLTGQNVIGTDDAWQLVRLTYAAVCRALELPASEIADKAISDGNVRIRRADCTFLYHVGTDEDARIWMRGMEQCCNIKFRGRGHYDEGMSCLLFGVNIVPGEKPKGSRYSSFKFYLKSDELKKRPLRAPAWAMAELLELAHGHVRAEALYRLPELEAYNASWLHQWDDTTPLRLNRAWMEKMEIAPEVELTDEMFRKLPRHLVATYVLWKDGHDPRTLMPRPTFYRHRKALLEFGIDIATPGTGAAPRTVVPVLRVIEARPACLERGPELFRRLLLVA
ncbi:MAG: phage/plasmid replication protein, II/X family, partial [Pseudomonadota bacterium]